MMGLIAEVVIHLTFRTYYYVTNHYDNTNAFPKLLIGAFLASCAQWQGSVLKRTTSSSFAYRLTSERVRSTIIIGVPAFISFVVPVSVPLYA